MKAGIKDFDTGYQMLDNFGVRAVYMDLDKPETSRNALRGATKVIYFPCSTVDDLTQLQTLTFAHLFCFYSQCGSQKGRCGTYCCSVLFG